MPPMPTTKQLGKLLTGLAGEFMVAGQLCMRGYFASLTLKNYPEVDIFVLNPRTDKQVAVQVKTAAVRRPKAAATRSQIPQGVYFLPESCRESHAVYVFVTIDPDLRVSYFIAPARDVARAADKERKAYLARAKAMGKAPNPIQPLMISLDALSRYKDKWENLGLGAKGAPEPNSAPQEALD